MVGARISRTHSPEAPLDAAVPADVLALEVLRLVDELGRWTGRDGPAADSGVSGKSSGAQPAMSGFLLQERKRIYGEQAAPVASERG